MAKDCSDKKYRNDNILSTANR